MAIKARVDDSILIIVDVQPSFMRGVWEAERVVARSAFLLEIAALLEIPVVATVQNLDRMGGPDPRVEGLLPGPALPKMTFSCCGIPPFREALEATRRRQVVLIGVETHICVSQTAVDLLNNGYEVLVCPDSVSARSVEMHKLGMERMRDSGVLPIHSESVAYEWMGSAEHPRFREALKVVKARSL